MRRSPAIARLAAPAPFETPEAAARAIYARTGRTPPASITLHSALTGRTIVVSLRDGPEVRPRIRNVRA